MSGLLDKCKFCFWFLSRHLPGGFICRKQARNMVLHLDVESEKNFRVKDSCLLKDSVHGV